MIDEDGKWVSLRPVRGPGNEPGDWMGPAVMVVQTVFLLAFVAFLCGWIP